MTAAELTALAAEISASLTAKGLTTKQAVMVCGMTGARLASVADKQDPSNDPRTLASILAQGFNAAMMIESAGEVPMPNRVVFGQAGLT